jgi:putative flavoprotein involved in K+ transport
MREHTEVVGLAEDNDGKGFVLSLLEGSIHARQVVLATGPFQRPFIPPMASDVSPSVLQTDPTRYRSPQDLPNGAVLVVGTGASGCQIADELLQAGRRVFLSVSRHRRVPRRFRGRDVYWWLEKLGRFDQPIDTFPDRRWPPSTVITGVNGGYDVDVRRMAADGVIVVGRVLGASESTVALAANANAILDEADQAYASFLSAAREFVTKARLHGDLADESEPDPPPLPAALEERDSLDLHQQNITTILWATGYAYDYGWVKVPVFDDGGRPVQNRGVTQVPGLYFLGLHWMHTFKSGLFSGVGSDAEYLAEHMGLVTGR